jgi:RIO kinase 1
MSAALEPLIADGVIEAVLGQLKSGKEAEVWLVQHAGQAVAAKVYKERHERNFANNAGYREGRDVRNSRTRRAMAKGSRFGQAAAEEAWKNAEAEALYKLHALGVRVPTPVIFYEGVLVMELVRDAEGAVAPRMVEAPPRSPEEARALYLDLRAQAVAMLSADLIHGDLSAYNILMSERGAVIIDFPQIIAAARNNSAEQYFRRDLDNVRNFLAAYDGGLASFAGDTRDIWNAYVRRDLTCDYQPPVAGRTQPSAPARPPPPAARPPTALPPKHAPAGDDVDAAERELRELEALVLRQGGGERAKPPGAGAKKELPQGRRSPGGQRGPGPRGGGQPRAQGAPQGRGGGQQPRNVAAGPRPGGQQPRSGAEQPHAGGQQARPGGGQARDGGQPPRNVGQQPRDRSQQARDGGQPPRNGGHSARGGAGQPRNDGQQPRDRGQPRGGGHPHREGQPPREQGQPPRGGGQPPRNEHRPGGSSPAGQRGAHRGPKGTKGAGQDRRPRSGPEVSYVTRPGSR